MSFYTVIRTELRNRKYLLLETVEVDRHGDIINVIRDKAGNYQVAGDNRVVRAFSDRLKQAYAYESIKDNLPLDFEIAKETETAAGEIMILLKG
ncbi:MAG: hypothetical protein HZB83_02455 [Deltaproteobacteria bacterium]|nr:hypothetical protein [Deltaproteobacteria bacterium]